MNKYIQRLYDSYCDRMRLIWLQDNIKFYEAIERAKKYGDTKAVFDKDMNIKFVYNKEK